MPFNSNESNSSFIHSKCTRFSERSSAKSIILGKPKFCRDFNLYMLERALIVRAEFGEVLWNDCNCSSINIIMSKVNTLYNYFTSPKTPKQPNNKPVHDEKPATPKRAREQKNKGIYCMMITIVVCVINIIDQCDEKHSLCTIWPHMVAKHKIEELRFHTAIL